MKKRLHYIGVLLITTLFLAGCGTPAETAEESAAPETEAAGTEAAAAAGSESNKPQVEIEIADYGTIKLELEPEQAPLSVANFTELANDGFYDGLTFHRIMKDFMMQGGDPQGDGSGGSDKTIKGEFTDNGVNNILSHTRGAVSMARSMDMDSASSQFFIVHQDSTFLDGQYAVFGYVTEGMEIVDEICESAAPVDDNGSIPAEEQPVITAVKVIE